MTRRVLALMLVLGVLVNSFGFAFTEDDFVLEGVGSLGNAFSETDIGLEDAEPSADVIGMEMGEHAGSLGGEADADEADDAYSYRLRDESPVLLSEILKKLELDIKPEDVELVTMLGGGIVEDPQKGPVEATGDLLSVEPLEDEEKTDYRITPLRDFIEAGVMVYTERETYTIRLKHNVEEAPEELSLDLTLDAHEDAPEAEATEIPTEEPTTVPTEETTHEPTEVESEELIEARISEDVEVPEAESTEEQTEVDIEDSDEAAIDAPTEAPATEEPVEVLIDEPAVESTEEPAVEPTEEPAATPAAYPAQTFAARSSGIDVSVSAPEGAFPEGTTIKVRRVWDAGTLSDARESVAEDFVEVKRVQAVDITFYDAEGNEIEPLLPIAVSIAVSEIGEDQEALVLHVDDAGETQVVAQNDAAETADGQTAVAFEADAFSVYIVVVTETIETRYIDASGATYAIELGYGADAGIPSGAALAVSELTGDEAEAYAAQAAEVLDVATESVAYAKALDIAIMNGFEDVQPAAPVQVSIKLLDVPENLSEENISVLHFGDEVEAVDCALNGDAVEFEADGFSVYVVTYTVDFHYHGTTYNLPGGNSMLLSSLLYILDVQEISIDDVADVTFTDPALLNIEKIDGETGRAIWEEQKAAELWTDTEETAYEEPAVEAEENDSAIEPDNEELDPEVAANTEHEQPAEDIPAEPAEPADIPESDLPDEYTAETDWLLTALQAFDTEEALTLTLKNGSAFVLRVTDAAPASYKYYVERNNGANGQSFNTLAEAVESINTRAYACYLYIGEDCTLDSGVTFTSTRNYAVTIYGNGHTITRGAGCTGDMITYGRTGGASLSIQRLTLDGNDVPATGSLLKFSNNVLVNLTDFTARNHTATTAGVCAVDHGAVGTAGYLRIYSASIIGNTAAGMPANLKINGTTRMYVYNSLTQDIGITSTDKYKNGDQFGYLVTSANTGMNHLKNDASDYLYGSSNGHVISWTPDLTKVDDLDVMFGFPNVKVDDLKTYPTAADLATLPAGALPGINNETTDNPYMVWKSVKYNDDNSVDITLNYYEKQVGMKLDFIFVIDETGTMSDNKSANGYRFSQALWARYAALEASKGVLELNDTYPKATYGTENRVRFISWGGSNKHDTGFINNYASALASIDYAVIGGGTNHSYAVNAATAAAQESRNAGHKPIIIYLSDYQSHFRVRDAGGASWIATSEMTALQNAAEAIYAFLVYETHSDTIANRMSLMTPLQYWMADRDDPSTLITPFVEIVHDAVSRCGRNTSVADTLSVGLAPSAAANTVTSSGSPATDAVTNQNGVETWRLLNSSNADNRLKTAQMYTKTIHIPMTDDVYSGDTETNSKLEVKVSTSVVNQINTSPVLNKSVKMALGMLTEAGDQTDTRITGSTFILTKNGAEVWTGTSGANGALEIPHAGDTMFAPGETYTLTQTSYKSAEADDPRVVQPTTNYTWTLTVGTDGKITSTASGGAPAMTSKSGQFGIWNIEYVEHIVPLKAIVVQKVWDSSVPESQKQNVPFTVYGVSGATKTKLSAYSTESRDSISINELNIGDGYTDKNQTYAWARKIFVEPYDSYEIREQNDSQSSLLVNDATDGEGKPGKWNTPNVIPTNATESALDESSAVGSGTVPNEERVNHYYFSFNYGNASSNTDFLSWLRTILVSGYDATFQEYYIDSLEFAYNDDGIVYTDTFSFSDFKLNANTTYRVAFDSAINITGNTNVTLNGVTGHVKLRKLENWSWKYYSFTLNGLEDYVSQCAIYLNRPSGTTVTASITEKRTGRDAQFVDVSVPLYKITNSFESYKRIGLTSVWNDSVGDGTITKVKYRVQDSAGNVLMEPEVNKGETAYVYIPELNDARPLGSEYIVYQQSYTVQGVDEPVKNAENSYGFDAFDTTLTYGSEPLDSVAIQLRSLSGFDTVTFYNTRKMLPVTVKATWEPPLADDDTVNTSGIPYVLKWSDATGGSHSATVNKESAEDNDTPWTKKHSDIPNYSLTGEMTVCTVNSTQDPHPDYNTQVTAAMENDSQVFTFVNTLKLSEVTISKVWDYGTLPVANYPTSVTIQVQKQRDQWNWEAVTPAGESSANIVLTADMDWEKTIQLPINTTYRFKETAVQGVDNLDYNPNWRVGYRNLNDSTQTGYTYPVNNYPGMDIDLEKDEVVSLRIFNQYWDPREIPVHLLEATLDESGDVVFINRDSELADGKTKLTLSRWNTMAVDNPDTYVKDGEFKNRTMQAQFTHDGQKIDFIVLARNMDEILEDNAAVVPPATGLLNTKEGAMYGCTDVNGTGGTPLNGEEIYIIRFRKQIVIPFHYMEADPEGDLTLIPDDMLDLNENGGGNALRSYTFGQTSSPAANGWMGNPHWAVRGENRNEWNIRYAIDDQDVTNHPTTDTLNLSGALLVRYDWDGIYYSYDSDPDTATWTKILTNEIAYYIVYAQPAAAYLKLDNKTSDDYWFKLTIDNGSYNGVMRKRGDDDQSDHPAQGTDGNKYYSLKVTAGNSDLLFLPKAADLEYKVEIYKDEALTNKVTLLENEWIQTGDKTTDKVPAYETNGYYTGTLPAGPSYQVLIGDDTISKKQEKLSDAVKTYYYDHRNDERNCYVIAENSNRLTNVQIVDISIARVSNDGGNTWTYHAWLINDGKVKETFKGAFDQANSLTGNVVIETLRETAEINGQDRYTLPAGSRVYFNNNADITLTTTQDTTWNSTGFVSTITRAADFDDYPMFFLDNGGLTLKDITLDGNNVQVKYDGSFVLADGASVTIQDGATLKDAKSVVVDGNSNASGYGGAIHLQGASTFAMTGGTITNCHALHGGAVSDTGTGSMKISGGIIDGCTATGGNGGGIFKREGELAISGNAVIQNCKAGQGGGLDLRDERENGTATATLSISDTVQIKDCYASGCGGGINAMNTPNAQISGNVVISGCKAGWDYTSINEEGTYGVQEASGDGGAINFESTGLEFTGNVRINDCTAVNGGGIRLAQNATASESGLLIDGHSRNQITGDDAANERDAQAASANAVNGGGVYVSAGAKFTFGGGEITKCKASENGGAVFNAGEVDIAEIEEEGSNHILMDGSLEYCSAKNGGAIYNTGTGTVDMTGGYIEHCMATENGGGIYTNSTGKQTIGGQSKGAVNLHTTTKQPGVISDCRAANGGGVYVAEGSELDMTGGTVKNCQAELKTGDAPNAQGKAESGNGGGVYTWANAVNITDSKVTGCTAGWCGGGVVASGTTTIVGCQINDNSAGGYGGGIYGFGGTKIHLTNTASGEPNDSTVNQNSAQNGGGIYLADGENGEIKLQNGVEVNNNTVTSYGGGVYTGKNTKLEVLATHINGNTGAINGGGIYADTATVDTVGEARIQNNTAYTASVTNNAVLGSGGAIFMQGGTLNLKGATHITGNTATREAGVESDYTGCGGAVYLNAATATIHVADVQITGNRADHDGGAIYAYNSTVSTSGTIGASDNANIAVNNGGGIYLASVGGKSTATISGGTIAYNTAWNGAGVYLANGSETTVRGGSIDHNAASSNGGGVMAANASKFTMSAGTVSNNTASGDGGGLFMANESVFSMTGGTVSGNIANGNGGGIYHGSTGTLTITGTITKDVSNVQITGNTATGNGGGIALANVAKNGTNFKATIFNATIASNTATTGNGGGIYMLDSALKISSTVIGDRAESSKGNSAICGGGIFVDKTKQYSTGELSLEGCDICYNSARDCGGGYADCMSIWNYCNVSLTDCNITNNRAIYGGGVKVGGGNFTMTRGNLSNNHANVDDTRTDSSNGINKFKGIGGGLFNENTDKDAIKFDGTIISGNTASIQGGGISADRVHLFNGVQITGNSIEQATRVNGGGAYIIRGMWLDDANLKVDAYPITVTSNYAGTGDAKLLSNLHIPMANSKPISPWKNGNDVRGVWVDSNLTGIIGVCNAGPAYTFFGQSNPAHHVGEDKFVDDAGNYFSIYNPADVDDEGNMKYEKIIWWRDPVCKITDKDDAILTYDNGTLAMFETLELALTAYQRSDFRRLDGTTVATQEKIQMLVPEYQITEVIGENGKHELRKSFELTTAAEGPGVLDYHKKVPAEGETEGERAQYCTITSVSDTNYMFRLAYPDVTMKVTGITLDGSANTRNGKQLLIRGDGRTRIEIGNDAILQNSPGGALWTEGGANGSASAALYDNALITNCQGSNGAAVYIHKTASLEMSDEAQITNCRAIKKDSFTGEGGAVFISGTGSSFTMTGGTISGSSADVAGGAVYIATGGVMTLKNGTMTVEDEAGNAKTVATHPTIKGNSISKADGNGAGIYVADKATLNLEGSPDFGGTDTYAETDTIPEGSEAGDIKGSDGNFVIKTSAFKVGDDEPANGGEAYVKQAVEDDTNYKVRQDIFIAGTGDPIKSVVVTGDLTGDPGTIWVWAEKDKHYKNEMQFAVFSASYETPEGEALETMLKVFRNAQPDGVTDNPNSEMYLYGVPGADGNIIWGTDPSGYRKVILRKVVGDTYAPLPRAKFTVYRGGSTTAYTVTHRDAAKTKETLSPLESLDSGVFWIGELPYGTYFLEETETPSTVKQNSDGWWYYLIVDESGVYISNQFVSRETAKVEADNKAKAIKAAKEAA